MKISLHLHTPNAGEEIVGLNDFIREQNIKGLITKIPEIEPPTGTMSVSDYMPMIELLLGSTVVAAGVKGIFDAVKNYFDLRGMKISKDAEVERSKMDQGIITLDFESGQGKKINLKFNSFDDNERKQFLETFDRVFNT